MISEASVQYIQELNTEPAPVNPEKENLKATPRLATETEIFSTPAVLSVPERG